eukprot:6185369-Pleurochrysis_carterae.AAC.1
MERLYYVYHIIICAPCRARHEVPGSFCGNLGVFCAPCCRNLISGYAECRSDLVYAVSSAGSGYRVQVCAAGSIKKQLYDEVSGTALNMNSSIHEKNMHIDDIYEYEIGKRDMEIY